MDTNLVNDVFKNGFSVLEKILDTQSENLVDAARLIADSFLAGNKFFVTGSGHSHTVAEEFYGRAGGLAFPVPIMTCELTLEEHPTKSSAIERLPGYAKILVDLYGVKEGDVVLIASNSGRNAYPIEMALESKARGAKVIAITNVNHSLATSSRHESNRRLLDIADVVIDNCGVLGDCAMSLEGLSAAVCPTSSMANAFISQAITVQCAQFILDAGQTPPVFVSLNVEGTENLNDEYFKQYTRQY